MEELTRRSRSSNQIRTLAVVSALGVVLATGGCAAKQEGDRLRAEKQQLTDENQKLTQTLQTMRTESAEANATLDEVQKGLEDIRAKELKIIQNSIRVAQEGKGAGERRERLDAEIKVVRDAVRKNLQKLAKLEKASKESGVKVASLEKLAEELKRSLEEKDTTVAALESRVGDLSKTIESQKSTLAEKEAVIHEGETRIAEKTRELNTAYVAVASQDMLKGKGVVEKRGDILGVGGRWIETGKFDPTVFREVDVTKDLEVSIPAPAKKVRIVTAQPKGSYAIVDGGPKSRTSRLEVKDPAAFWKGDRYLVVMIPD